MRILLVFAALLMVSSCAGNKSFRESYSQEGFQEAVLEFDLTAEQEAAQPISSEKTFMQSATFKSLERYRQYMQMYAQWEIAKKCGDKDPYSAKIREIFPAVSQVMHQTYARLLLEPLEEQQSRWTAKQGIDCSKANYPVRVRDGSNWSMQQLWYTKMLRLYKIMSLYKAV